MRLCVRTMVYECNLLPRIEGPFNIYLFSKKIYFLEYSNCSSNRSNIDRQIISLCDCTILAFVISFRQRPFSLGVNLFCYRLSLKRRAQGSVVEGGAGL